MNKCEVCGPLTAKSNLTICQIHGGLFSLNLFLGVTTSMLISSGHIVNKQKKVDIVYLCIVSQFTLVVDLNEPIRNCLVVVDVRYKPLREGFQRSRLMYLKQDMKVIRMPGPQVRYDSREMRE